RLTNVRLVFTETTQMKRIVFALVSLRVERNRMFHDKNGRYLEVGDVVTVRCKIKAIQMTKEYCNLSLETEAPMYPSDNRSALSLNAKQVEKLALSAEDDPAPIKYDEEAWKRCTRGK